MAKTNDFIQNEEQLDHDQLSPYQIWELENYGNTLPVFDNPFCQETNEPSTNEVAFIFKNENPQ